ncbi:uncharacterized protein F5147DRAFT_758393 [Suillus discolor]|uniref:Uncharacterized protein n=1 Tax=Suillus discolor TaxID=1912936 RepID=A0A9P7FEB4_9AGAM|nr:uncharacterized protein F5147DRAFT_758393 [Suillus discolor]KAG2115897.1 hypothetical protein F5147DRAFT_758393 [Suillus discolor]
MSKDHRPEPPPEASGSRDATAGESTNQPRSGFCQTLRKVKKNVAKKVSRRFKRSHSQISTIQNTDHGGASSNHDIEDASCLHPSDGNKPATSENLSGCENQVASGEPASKVPDTPPGVEEIPDPQSVDAGLQGAHEATESMRLLGGHVASFLSKAEDGPRDLAAADNLPTTYLRKLKIFDTVIENLVNVHPYAKMVLGMLSAASKIILAQTERDKSVQTLLEKLQQVYDFMSQEDTLSQILSKHSITRRIAQQTLEEETREKYCLRDE